jgi:hypothetical protein
MDGMVIPHEVRVRNGYERHLSSRIKKYMRFACVDVRKSIRNLLATSLRSFLAPSTFTLQSSTVLHKSFHLSLSKINPDIQGHVSLQASLLLVKKEIFFQHCSIFVNLFAPPTLPYIFLFILFKFITLVQISHPPYKVLKFPCPPARQLTTYNCSVAQPVGS